ncbi:LysM peptidoglycan-binding domain-containing protein [Maritalea porphyrae]|uniref:LysM peptidoglycan-binding domain-containing protein n=1 Tax=Maritalea porphyrae TaxID=880732 RepID=UPI0022AE5604|nr:LysM peptidoglycan-binding domain-containing protein [Maritalea porphyrae]MCZ4271013.1 LysM peptidoglycan-binding domain-containing protein [Maritalea porphyrae]
MKTEDGGSENGPAATTETSQTAALNDQASPPVAQNDIAVVVPEFTIARATADGLVVIVGTAAVGDTVIVKSNGQILGKTKPERTGEWVFVPENPLATGGVEITVEAQDAKGNFTPSAKSEIVLIHEGRDQEPIVVASVPGEASSIIQGLEPKVVEVAEAIVESTPEVVESPTEVAAPTDSIDSENSPETAVVAAEQPSTTPTEPKTEETAVETAETPVVVEDAQDTLSETTEVAEVVTQAVAPTVEAVEEVAEATTDPVVETAPVVATEQAVDDAVPATQETAEALVEATETNVVDAVSEAAEVQTEVAQAETTPVEVETAPTAQEVATAEAAQAAVDAIEQFVQPTIDAIEIDGTMNFIAGAGPDGATMRIYVDNQYVADAVVADGRWLVEAQNVLTKPTQRVRADLLVADTSQVSARTEVNFVVENLAEIPAAHETATDTVAVAETSTPAAEETATAAPEATATQEQAETANADTQTAVETANTNEAAPVVEEQAAVAQAETAIETDAATTPTPQVPDQTTASAAVETPPVEAAQQPDPEAVASQTVPDPSAPEPAMDTAETSTQPATDQVSTITAVAVGEGDDQRFVSGKAIIRKGDNLWTIARRVYGSGVKYTTIYEANANSISNPHMIFPGQVFELPDQE